MATPKKFTKEDILTVKSSTVLDELKKYPDMSAHIENIKKYNNDLEEHLTSLYTLASSSGGFFSNPTGGKILKPTPTEPTESINIVLNKLNTPDQPANPTSLLDTIRAKLGMFAPRGGSNRKSNRKRKPKRKTRKCNKCPRCGAGKLLQELGADGHCHCNQCGHVY